MKYIAKNILWIFLLCCFLWMATDVGISYIFGSSETVDTGGPAVILYRSQHATLVGEEHLLTKTARPKMIIFGGSSSRDAFRPPLLTPLFPQYEIHNIALTAGYENVLHEHEQILKDTYRQLPHHVREKSFFIYGISPTLFYFYNDKKELTQYDRSRLIMFPSLYRQDNEGNVTSIFSSKITALVKRIYRPFIGLQTLVEYRRNKKRKKTLQGFHNNKAPILSQPPIHHKGMHNSEADFIQDFQKFEAKDKEAIASLDKALFNFKQTLAFAKKENISLAVVFLPWPEWARTHVPSYGELKKQIEHTLYQFSYPRLQYMDMSEALPDIVFRDINHVSRHGAPEFAFLFWQKISQRQ
ncbi:hypothetical protein LJC26_01960 [Desulfovibrio sp. OttesenSCG-928-O18]|nr:hypothetical protein [Desulfovibrio sp. OttesenSCG-928-O18]